MLAIVRRIIPLVTTNTIPTITTMVTIASCQRSTAAASLQPDLHHDLGPQHEDPERAVDAINESMQYIKCAWLWERHPEERDYIRKLRPEITQSRKLDCAADAPVGRPHA